MMDRAENEKGESDVAYFNALMYAGEVVMKLTVAGLVAAIQNDKYRNRYRLERLLVRADGLGDWNKALDDILTGPSSQFLDHAALATTQALTERVPEETWQSVSLQDLSKSIQYVNLESSPQPTNRRVQGRTWFKDFVLLRNGTRGHGAPLATALGLACPSLKSSIAGMASNIPIFSLPWAYLYRSLSGKYRVTTWGKSGDMLERLKRESDHSFNNGVHIEFEKLRYLSLVESNPERSDYWLANGGFGKSKYEMLSYWTNDRLDKPSSPYMSPVEELPPSETEGLGQLEIKGSVFTNIPEPLSKYVPRPHLEKELEDQLRESERHPIVTLTGRGGIGKTSTALQVITKMMDSDNCPYDVVVWFSARDVDLLQSGPKEVQPGGLSIRDFASEYANLLTPGEMNHGKFSPPDYLARQMSGDTIGPTLFVFDNFETVTSPIEVFTWLDTFVRGPNKVLITSRHRGFTGDYEVQVRGMTHSEAEELIIQTAESIGIRHKIAATYIEELIEESNGHPYIIKLLLGEVARAPSSTHPKRIMAAQDEALVALFERSYNMLSPAAKRVFLTLCKWRSSVPALAVEAVLLRPENERIDVGEAIVELVQSFFIEEVLDNSTGESEVNVSLAARLFGLRKLEVSEWQAAIETDIPLLHLVGARAIGNSPAIGTRIAQMFHNVSVELREGTREFSEMLPVLEFLTTRYSYAYVLLARLVSEFSQDEDSTEEERYLLAYVEGTMHPGEPAWATWKRIATIRRQRGNVSGELVALAQSCRHNGTPTSELSDAANQINSILNQESQSSIARETKQFLIKDVVGALNRQSEELDATDFSRLAWLQLHLDDPVSALKAVHRGLTIDKNNHYCLGLQARLSN